MFCFQLHARAYRTMNEKFSILHEAKLKFGVHCAVSKSALKIKHELTFSNPFNIQFESTAGDRFTIMASHPACLNEKTMN